jgi:prolyl-tRNA editing enzyme YbaK/EbsC (Cys-tRNA(Pro) deacylase)
MRRGAVARSASVDHGWVGGPDRVTFGDTGAMSAGALHPSVEKINAILAEAGMPGRVRILPEAAPTAQAAADQLGCPVGAIANSLVFATGAGDPLLVMTSGAHRVDTPSLGNRLGITVHRAGADFVRAHTSQPIGGVAPVGHPQRLRTIIDVDLAGYPQLWAAGGIPHAVFPLSYADLVALTGGEELRVS